MKTLAIAIALLIILIVIIAKVAKKVEKKMDAEFDEWEKELDNPKMIPFHRKYSGLKRYAKAPKIKK